jgi:hypothetical protein
MLVTTDEAVEVNKVTVRGVGRGAGGLRIEVDVDLRMQTDNAELVCEGRKVVSQMLLDSADYGEAEAERKNTLSVRIRREFPRLIYRFMAVGVPALPGEPMRLDPAVGTQTDRVVEVDATLHGAPEARAVSGTLELRWKIRAMLDYADACRLLTMVGLDTVSLTTKSVQGELAFGAQEAV